MERNLALEVVRATEAAALCGGGAIYRQGRRTHGGIGRPAMRLRKTLNSVAMDGKNRDSVKARKTTRISL